MIAQFIRSRSGGALALALLVAGTTLAPAQLPSTRLATIFPAGASAGATVDVTISGTDVDAPTALVFSDPRITAKPSASNPAAFSVTVPSDLQPGIVDVRILARLGLSNPRGFQVGVEPEILANPTNSVMSSAIPVPFDTIVNGRAQAGTAHWFRFEGRQGQRLLIGVIAREIDSRFVPDIAVFDGAGGELSIVRRSQTLDFRCPTDGTFHVRLNDQTFRGGDEYAYRLSISSRPRVEFVLPLAATAEANQTMTLLGRNLPGSKVSSLIAPDGAPLEQLEVSLTPDAKPGDPALLLRKPAAAVLAPEAFAWSPSIGGEHLPATLLCRTTATNLWSLSDGIHPVVTPCDFSGVFPARGQLSGVSFQASKDAVFWVEVFSDRLGFNTDPHFVIQRIRTDDKGVANYQDVADFGDTEGNQGGREFDTSSRDPVGRFQVPEDGAYRILVRDLFRTGPNGARRPYRLQIRRETPDYRLAVYPQPPPRRDDNDRQIHLWTPALRRGGTVPLRVVALRRDGFDGPIEITARGLPPGVTCSGARIAAGQSSTALILAASTNAAAGSSSVVVTGRARILDQDVDRDAATASLRWHVQDWDQEKGVPRFTEGLRFSVIDAELAPVAMTPSEPKTVEVAAKGKLKVPLEIIRRGEFQGAFKIKPFGHPSLDKAKEIDVPEKATNVVLEVDLNEFALPEGEHRLHVEATVAGKYRNNPEAAQVAEEAAKSAASQAAETKSAVKSAEEKLASLRKAEEEASAALKIAQGSTATGADPSAAEARVAAEKRVQEATAARVAQEKSLADAQTAAKAAEERNAAAAASSKTATEKAQPKDVAVRTYSIPFAVKVTPAPKA